jgi:hypothetical protein
MLIELIVIPQSGSEQTKTINIRGLFRSCLPTQRSALGIVTIMSVCKVYYEPNHVAGFGSVAKLVKAGKTKKRDVEEWLSGQNTYTLHKLVRKRFPRNPYTVTNIDNVWKMDLADFSSLSKYNDKHKYLLNV